WRGRTALWARSSTRRPSRSTAHRPSTCSRGTPTGSTSATSRPSTTRSSTAPSRWLARSTASRTAVDTARAPRPSRTAGRRTRRPSPAVVDGEIPWRLTSHLSLNYPTVADLDEEHGATALREFLELYADLVDADMPDAASRRQAQGVRRVAVTPRTRRLPAPG